MGKNTKEKKALSAEFWNEQSAVLLSLSSKLSSSSSSSKSSSSSSSTSTKQTKKTTAKD